ncbi:MAG TPA: glycosyltransferase family 4 protein [Polyangia bacterium]|nr:glycosyltransferase family 4 protein [Polyangia bacterium]
MRIAEIAPLYESVPPKLYGGTERVVSYLTEELVAEGHDVTLFASGDSQTGAELVPMCGQALRLGGSCVDQLAHHMRMVEEVYRRADEFDLLHFHIDYMHFPTSARTEAARVSTMHGRLDIPDLEPLYRTFPDEPVVSISDSQRQPLSFANWVGTVHHGLPADLLQFQPRPGQYLAFLGRISPEKRPDRAIEVARRTGIPLKMAAKIDNADRVYYEQVIKPLMDPGIVEYIGEIGESDKSAFLGDALALMFLIDWSEPFGLVMIESMACGTPVVACPRGSVPEVIEEGRSGMLVDDVDGAVAALKNIEAFDRAGCRQRFDERFVASRMAGDYLELFRDLSHGRKLAATRTVAGG